MRRVFESATLKLTGWYLLILMVISLLFSTIIFQISTQELNNRLERLQISLEDDSRWIVPGGYSFEQMRMHQANEASASIFFGLLYINLAVLGLGGIGSYLLARRTLRPIEAMHEAQSRFTSDASHELKTPLAVMKSELELSLRDTTMTKGDYKEVVSSTLEEVNKLSSLTHALLQLSRLDHASIPRDEKVNIGTQLTHVSKLLDSTGRIHMKLPKQAAIIEGNESMLRDLCMITLDNALRYSPPDSTIDVQLKRSGKSCTLIVTNTGPGIAAHDLPHIFDRFYRGDRSRTSTDQVKSYGLGLSLAKKIVDMHGGTITITSLLNKHTTVTTILPNFSENR